MNAMQISQLLRTDFCSYFHLIHRFIYAFHNSQVSAILHATSGVDKAKEPPKRTGRTRSNRPEQSVSVRLLSQQPRQPLRQLRRLNQSRAHFRQLRAKRRRLMELPHQCILSKRTVVFLAGEEASEADEGGEHHAQRPHFRCGFRCR